MVYTLTSDMIKNVGNNGEVRGLVTDYSLKDLCLVRATDYYEDINLKSLTQAKMLKKDYSIFLYTRKVLCNILITRIDKHMYV